jgi:hypothetical protein
MDKVLPILDTVAPQSAAELVAGGSLDRNRIVVGDIGVSH